MTRVRVEYKKEKFFIFLSNLDIIRFWERALRRSELPIVFTQGFNPKPKMDFSPAIPLGIPSESEIIEFYLNQKISNEEIFEKLNKVVDKELKIKRVKDLKLFSPPISSIITHFEIELQGENFKKFDFKNLKIKKGDGSLIELKNFILFEEEKIFGKKLILSKSLSLRLFYENLKKFSQDEIFIKKIRNLKNLNCEIYDAFDIE